MNVEEVRERLATLDRHQRVGVVAVVLLIVAGVGLWYARSLPRPVEVRAAGGRQPALPAVASPSPSPTIIVIDVAGWVKHPGVYRFHQGQRVIDAIRQAGGARPGADLTSINLAALLVDSEQIVVGKSGGTVASGTSTGASGSSGAAGAGALVNINTATLDQLESLPGIGPALGQRIIDYRQAHGPFHSVQDLLNVSGIGEKRLEDLKPLVTV